MKVVNTYEAKTNLSKLLHAVQKGEEVVIAKAGRPIADLKRHRVQRPLKLGLLKGQVKIHGDIVSPDPKITKAFKDSRIFPDGPV